MTQLDLALPASHLPRVRASLAAPILSFCRARVGREFHMSELVEYVGPVCSPDSPSRILRDLRRSGDVECELVSRRDSLYRVTWVKP